MKLRNIFTMLTAALAFTFVGCEQQEQFLEEAKTLQQLADKIHKSRASVSKYETGEIVVDVETLYDISRALNVELNALTDYCDTKP